MGSVGGSFSKSKQGSQFGQDVYEGQKGPLDNLYAMGQQFMQSMAPQVQQQFQQGAEANQQTMGDMRGGMQNQLGGGVYGNMGLQNQFLNELQQSRGPSDESQINAQILGGQGNSYADAMKETYMRDAQNTRDQMLGTLDARSAASGMSGGARAGIAQGNAMSGINRNLQSELANVGYNTFDKNLDRSLGIAQRADSNTMARQQMLGNMLGQQQGVMNQGMDTGGQLFNMGNQMQNSGMNQLGQYSNVIGSPTVLGSGSSFGKSMSAGANASGGGK